MCGRVCVQTEHLKEMKTPYQFVMMHSSLERRRNFQALKKKHGSFWAWHGSGLGNWHAILREGLRNLSTSPLTAVTPSGLLYLC